MPYSVANKTPAAVLPASASADVPGQSQNDNGAVLAANAHYSAQAPKLVEEIRQIADRISVIDRNSVEVKFDFGDRDHLSVRVEYREGTVHTTFRTDSSQLRDAISHEWQAQNVAQDQRSYRVSEPVFSATTNDRQNFSTAGDGSGRQRSSEQPAHPAAPSYSSGRNGGGGSTATAPVGRSSRPETSRHLHALA